jgi:hypothetical protein
MGKNEKGKPTRLEDEAITFCITHSRINQQLQQAGGLDGVLHTVVVALAGVSGGEPPPQMIRFRERVRSGARVSITIRVDSEPPIRAIIGG